MAQYLDQLQELGQWRIEVKDEMDRLLSFVQGLKNPTVSHKATKLIKEWIDN